jgi:homoserine dehydrogenase
VILDSLPTQQHPSLNAAQTCKTVTLGMIGLGTVGGGVYKLLQRYGNVSLTRVAVRDLDKARQRFPDMPDTTLTNDPWQVVNDPDIQLVVEVMGGVEPARQLVRTALENGKHVVTANKALIATHGQELFDVARERGVGLLLEAAVCAGVPLIAPLRNSLRANEIEEIAGILNGTTNFMLTRMSQDGWTYEEALAYAQEKGFAEADPTSDVDGFDTAYKLSILSSIAFDRHLNPEMTYKEGIRGVSQEDIKLARQLGYVIKLIGLARLDHRAESVDLRVHPMLIRQEHPLASIHNEYNAVWVRGDAVGEVMFSGRGAGEMPTASGVCSDILSMAHAIQEGDSPRVLFSLGNACRPCSDGQSSITYQPISDTQNRYYLRLSTEDRSGVVGHIGAVLGRYDVSLKMLMQPESSRDNATLVLITHRVSESKMQNALNELKSLDTILGIEAIYRVMT